jgi:hypothetical protein
MKLKSKNNCESLLSEIGSLKIKVQHIKTENQTLRTSSNLNCSTKMDLKKIYVGRKAHDKMRLRYIERLPSLVFKVIRSPKEKGEQSQKLKNKSDNMQKTKYNKEKHNHAYQYRYSNRRNRNNNYYQEEIHLTLNGQIKFILDVLMVSFMN